MIRFLLILALALSFTPPAQQNTQERSRQSGDSQVRKNSISPQTTLPPKAITHPHQTESTDLHWYSDIKITDGLIALFTLGLVVVGFFQWRALQDTVREASESSTRQSADMQSSIAVARDAADASTVAATAAKDSAESYKVSQHAFVSLHSIEFIRKAADGVITWWFWPIWKNSGLTEATYVEAFAYVEEWFNDPGDSYTFPRGYANRDLFFIAPETLQAGRTFELPDDLIVKTTVKRSSWLYFYGQARYKDVFGEQHVMRFVKHIEMERGDPHGAEGSYAFRFVNWRWGNCADEQCEREDRERGAVLPEG